MDGSDAAGARELVRAIAHRLAQVDESTMLTVLALLALTACVAAVARGLLALLAWCALLGLCLVWLGVNQKWEGQVLYQVAPSHGLTQADLVVPGVLMATVAARLVVARQRRLHMLRQVRARRAGRHVVP